MNSTLKYISCLVLPAMLATGCVNDFLNTESPSKQTSENLFLTVSYTETAVMGNYGSMTESTVYGQKISTNWPTNSDIETAGLSLNDYNARSRDAGASNFYAYPENSNLQWERLYRALEGASNIVDGIRKSPLLETSDRDMMLALLGESLTQRALLYWEAIKHWSDVPFRSQSTQSDLSNVYIGKTDRDEIYASIIADLLEAEQYLPWLGNSVGRISYGQSDRITKGFVKGLCARVALFAGGWSIRDRNTFPNTDAISHPTIPEVNGYFTGRSPKWREYYELAARQCAEIIGSTENPHRLDGFEDYWKSINALSYSATNETMFEIAFGLGNSSDIGNLIGMRLDANTKYGTIQLGGGNVVSNAYYFYSFHKDDLRRDVTLTNIRYSSDNQEKMSSNPYDWKFAKWRIYWMTDAYKQLHSQATSGRVSTGINWVVMRYPDVLLMYAEAMNEISGPNTAHEAAGGITPAKALEMVRERAFGVGNEEVTKYDPDFFQAIVNERAWEFGGEGIRKYDLLRWGLLSEKIETMKEVSCKLLVENAGTVKIFDKSYTVADLPEKIYFRYTDDTKEFIDRSDINWYKKVDLVPTGYESQNWLYNDQGKSSGRAEHFAKILLQSTGLNPSYDYSALVAELDAFDYEEGHQKLSDIFSQYSMGNGTCYNRHPFGIYYKDVVDSQGNLVNSYGY